MHREDRDTRLLRYIEGELSPAERNEVERELDESPAAREVLTELARLYGDASIPHEEDRRRPVTTMRSESGARRERFEEVGAWAPSNATVGRYRVESPIGSGSMGVVYLARDPMLDRMVALKLMHPQAQDQRGTMRLLREARALAQVSHPNVVEVYDTGEHEGAVFLAMELVRGTTLERWVHREPRDWRAIVGAFAAAGRGLAAAHAVGLVHRDFKPANVLVRQDGRVVVTDFGLVRDAIEVVELADEDQVLPPRDDLDAVTETGTILGTPAYMSPEQIVGRPVGSASDQFSFCVAIYEAVYGERPFHGRNLVELAESMRGGVVAPPRHRGTPRALWQVLARGLHPDAAGRWPSMTALVDALMELRDRRKRWPLAMGVGVGALLGLCVVAVAAYAFVSMPTPTPAQSGTTGEREPSPTETLREGLAEVEAQHALGRTLEAAGALEEAVRAHEAAYWLAQSHGHDRVMAESATSLVGLLAADPQRLEEAETWARHAHAVVDRLGTAAADVGAALADHEGVLAARRTGTRAAVAPSSSDPSDPRE